MTSVNFNSAANSALRTLQQSNAQLDATQSRISTGFKIGQAKDNAAYWSISTSLKSDNKSLSTVKDALGLGAATVDVAYQGLTKSKEVLDEIKSKLTAATQDGVDRSTIQAEITELQKQLKSIASSSVFAGENWLSVDTSSSSYQGTKGIVAGATRDANGSVSISTVDVKLGGLALFDANATSTGIINSAATLRKADGTELTVGGMNATGVVPSTAGLTGTTTEVKGAAVAAATGAKAALGYFTTSGLDVNDKLKFDLTLNGGPTSTVTVDLTSVSNAATFKTALEAGLNAAGFGAAGVNVDVAIDASTGAISFASKLTGTAASVTVANVITQDGDGAVVNGSKSGMVASAGVKNGTDTAATYTFNANYSGTNWQSGGVLTVSAELSGVTKTFDVTATTGTGTIDNFIVDMQTAVDAAFGAGKITVGKDAGGNKITLTSVAKGDTQSIIVNSVVVKTDPAGAPVFDTLGLDGVAARGTGTSTQAFYDSGTYAAATAGAQRQDRLQFQVQTNGQPDWKTVTVDLSKLDYTSQATYMAGLQSAVDATLGVGVVQVINGAGASTGGVAAGNIAFATVAKGAAASVQLRNVTVLDGNGTSTSKLGLTTGTATGTAAVVAATAASVVTGSAFIAPVTFDTQDSMSFKLTINGGAAKSIVVNRATVEAALTGSVGYTAGSGTVSTAADFAVVLKKALDNAAVTGINVSALTVAPDANKIKFESQTTGPATISSISLDATSVASSTGGDSISIDKINISDTALTALGVDGTNRKDVLAAYISIVNDAINKVTSAAANLGAVSSRIDMQKTFVNTLMDTIDKGVSGLIDADMNEESTKLQALQVKQQLGVQALSIANQSAQSVLSLFRQ